MVLYAGVRENQLTLEGFFGGFIELEPPGRTCPKVYPLSIQVMETPPLFLHRCLIEDSCWRGNKECWLEERGFPNEDSILQDAEHSGSYPANH